MSAPPEPDSLVRAPAFTASTLLTFVVLGGPDGLLGVAWPHMTRVYREPASALSVLIVCSTGAFFVSSLASAALARRWTAPRLLLVAAALAAAGGVVVGLSSTLAVGALGVSLLGLGGGMLDPALSSIASLDVGTRLVSLMHGMYSLGAMGAPLLLAIWTAAAAWRWGYGAVAAGYAITLASWLVLGGRRRLPLPRPRDERSAPAEAQAPPTPRADRRGLLFALAAFVAVSGLELSVAGWAAVYLTDGLGQRAATASACVLGYWIALSVTRLGSGLVAVHRPVTWLMGGCALAVFGAALLVAAQHTDVAVAVVGLVLLGAGAGPLLPVLTARTPHRVGPAAAAQAIGWQLAAASVGAALVSGGIGVWVHASGVGAVAPALALTAVATTVVVAAVELRPPGRPGGAITPSATAAPPDPAPRR